MKPLVYPRILPTGDDDLDRRLNHRLRACLDRLQDFERREREIALARIGAGPWPEQSDEGIAVPSCGPSSPADTDPSTVGVSAPITLAA